MEQYIIGFVAIVLTFGLAVFVHELGHMLFALWRGVGVDHFAIGMGPKICSWKWWGIEFSLRWLPIGGFVSIRGMVLEDYEADQATGDDQAAPTEHPGPAPREAGTAEADAAAEPDRKSGGLADAAYADAAALANRDLPTKLMVFGGGVFMNLIAAWFAVFCVLLIGIRVPVTEFVVERVAEGGPAADYGLRPGDRIVAFNDAPVTYYYDFAQQLEPLADEAGAAGTVSFDLTVERDGRSIELPHREFPVGAEALTAWRESFDLHLKPAIGQVVPGMPAAKAGLEAGDRVTAINGQPIRTWDDLVEIVSSNAERPLVFKIQRGEDELSFQVTPRVAVDLSEDGAAAESGQKEGQIGIAYEGDETIVVRADGPVDALVRSPGETLHMLETIVVSTVRFFARASFQQIRENVGGPISIMVITADQAQGGLSQAIEWFAKLNLLLLFFNLLPIPVLDGGFILLSLIEGVIRRPVPPKVLKPVFSVFMVLLLGLIVMISFQDVLTHFF